MDDSLEFSDDFFRDEVDEKNIIQYESSTEIAYSQGPSLNVEVLPSEETYELPIISCECGAPIGITAGKFLAEMQQKQTELWSETGQKMTRDEFSHIGMSTLQKILNAERPLPKKGKVYKKCCEESVWHPVLAKWGRKETREDFSMDENWEFSDLCQVCQASIKAESKEFLSRMETEQEKFTDRYGVDESRMFEIGAPIRREIMSRLSNVVESERKFAQRTCCLTNIWEPIVDRWGLNKCKRFIEGERHPDLSSLMPGFGNTIYTSAPRHATTVIRKVSGVKSAATVPGDLKLRISYNPYNLEFNQMYNALFSQPPDLESEAKDAEYVPTPIATLPRPASDLFYVDESLFPSMPDSEGFVPELMIQEVLLPDAENLFAGKKGRSSYKPFITGIQSTGVAGMAVPVTSTTYLSR